MIFIDLTPFRCPVPLVQIKLALKKLPPGDVLEVLLLDSASRRDVHAFVEKQGYQVKKLLDEPNMLRLQISR